MYLRKSLLDLRHNLLVVCLQAIEAMPLVAHRIEVDIRTRKPLTIDQRATRAGRRRAIQARAIQLFGERHKLGLDRVLAPHERERMGARVVFLLARRCRWIGSVGHGGVLLRHMVRIAKDFEFATYFGHRGL